MAENTKIQWTHHTFNPWSGCAKVSAGCQFCYAEVNYSVKIRGVKWGPQGNRVVKAESGWKEPIAWNRKAAEAGERHRVFCASLADVFEDWQGPMLDASGRTLHRGDAWGCAEPWVPRAERIGQSLLTMQDVRDRLFKLIDVTPNLDWLILTKRPENIAKMMPAVGFPDAGVPGTLGRRLYFDNLWLGVSVEDQPSADKRLPIILATPAVVRFASFEPLLGPIEFIAPQCIYPKHNPNGPRVSSGCLDWAILGGESGDHARPCYVDWLRHLARQCRDSGTACFVKQYGANVLSRDVTGCRPTLNRLDLLDKKGGDMAEWAEDLRIREFPAPYHPQKGPSDVNVP